MADWLSVGNGWRNLYLLSSMAQALALGLVFAKHKLWIRRSAIGAFLAGAATTPLWQYLWTLALALLWPRAPKAVYIGVLPAAAGLTLLWLFLRHLKEVRALAARGLAWLRRALRLDRPALVSLCFAAAMAVLLTPIAIRTATSAYPAQADSGEYMALGLRYCEDRNLSELLEKDDQTGHFRGHSHFPSLELYMAYGLMHTGDTYGYPYDKPMFTGVGMLVFYLALAFAALLFAAAGGRKRWVLLGLLLFNLVPNLVSAVAGAPRDTWRCLALLAAAAGLWSLTPEGGPLRYAGKLLYITLLCFTVMSAHVVCFVVLPFLVAAWVLTRWLMSLYARDKKAGRTLLRSVGLALGGAAGTLAAYAGNLWCYFKWGEMSPWRLMTTFTGAPWYPMYMAGEYKLEATTRHLDFFRAYQDIVMAYATPLGIWSLRLALGGLAVVLAALALRRVRGRKTAGALLAGMPATDGAVSVAVVDGAAGAARQTRAEIVLLSSLIALLTLAPMSGLLDTKLYSFSGSFITMQRYTLQWFLFAAVAAVAALAALEGEWPALLRWLGQKLAKPSAWLRRRLPAFSGWLRRAPAWLCAMLCVLSFVQGTAESGYANSFYRYGRPMLTDPFMAQDTSFKARYSLLVQLKDLVPEGEKILVTRAGYQYALHAKGYVLTSNPIVPLMNLPLEAVGPVLSQMGVAALCTEPDFWDERYYARSTLSTYLSALPPEQIIDDGVMRIYLLDASLVGKLVMPKPQAAP